MVKRISFLLWGILLSLLLIPIFASAEETLLCSYFDEGISVVYFYSPTCPHCLKVEESGILNELSKEFNITINKTRASDNKEVFFQLCKYVEDDNFVCMGIPTLFVIDHDKSNMGDLKVLAIQGDTPIIQQSKEKISHFLANSSSVNQSCEKQTIWQALPIIIITGVSDSINPCIMSVLALLLIQISVISTRKRILKLGGIFTLTVFASYMLIGILILFISELFIMNLGHSVASAVGSILLWLIVLLLIIAGLINIKDFFWYGKGITFKIPEKYTKLVDTLVKKLSLPSILMLAVIITIIEFPCSGIMYIGVIGYLKTHFTNMATILLLLVIYNILFILPLVIMIMLTYFGTNPEHLDKIRVQYRGIFRLIMGLALVALAIYLLISQGLL
jgi:cytochrome c biogenesis protein CcdA